ncbi:MAG TPA: DUF2846 domain-containing protein [Terriglobales bacterium]|nr:DUF2846 domain-containing protein [Terriglobales bacterium]
MRAMKFVGLTLLLMTLIAAAQDQPQSSGGKEQKATVYVYRYKQFVGSGLSPSVYCDEVQLARMENGRYFSVAVDPGKHVFRSNDSQSGIELDAKAGQQYFIRLEIAAGMMKGHGRLILTAPEQARYELQSSKLKPLDSGKVVDKERVSIEEAKLDAQPAAPVPDAAPKPQIVPASATPQTVHGVTLNDGGNGGSSLTTDQTSLGEAARQNKKKKASDTGDNTAPPQ